jgi:hypothetical protein
MFLEKIKKVYSNVKNKFNGITILREKTYLEKRKEKTLEVLYTIMENSYYNEDTNTIVINTPTNIILKSHGSQVFIAENGYKVDIADKIHLNPIIPKKSKININKTNMRLDAILNNTENALIDK